ncbi:GNAT family N-acetyltransferase [Aerosakkonemataceae cyanobacterium BLCC-F50]|uniref:GNAT family N-acetyltransferase n=1 Tax=Floridaenema flaviceps BLCC-F50 TaxID=3153642 RepID=A0ABV4XTH1_9CYAN
METKIRPVQTDELQSLLELYQHLNPTDSLPDEEQLQKVWHQLLNDPKITCWVVDFEGTLIASCILVIVPNLTRNARPYALIENVVTHPEYRRQGIGKRLLDRVLQFAWSQNCYKVMLLSSSTREEAHQFYEKVGFSRDRKVGFVATPKANIHVDISKKTL